MKAIEDLGVSPLPWGAEQNGVPYVVDANGYNVATIDGDSIGQARSNTFLLKTAPRLYKELWNICFGDVPIFNCRKCHGVRFGACKPCFLFEARAALEDACGNVNSDAGGDNLADRVRDCLDEVAPSEEAQRLLNEDDLK